MRSETLTLIAGRTRIVPLAQVPTASGYTWLSLSTLRQWVFYAQDRYSADGNKIPGNGFDICILRVGRRVLIDLEKFQEWLLSHGPVKSENLEQEGTCSP